MVGQRPKLRGIAQARLDARGHAIKRARQRFSVTLSFDQVKEIEREILLEKWCRLGRRGDRGLYLVRRQATEMPAIYDYELGAIVTFLGDVSWW
ncbi:hypothetical protein sos41_31370 [Alphaproteobacteria bacterium SO-S41]|nr:hypothetical protein sos41_31370 [Alphaproteobacteria bacterium SO-S41]